MNSAAAALLPKVVDPPTFMTGPGVSILEQLLLYWTSSQLLNEYCDSQGKHRLIVDWVLTDICHQEYLQLLCIYIRVADTGEL